MFSIIFPCLNSLADLKQSLAAIPLGKDRGFDLVFADGGSNDGTERYAERCHAQFISAGNKRGMQKHAGADAAREEWLLFLHPGVVLSKGWQQAVTEFIAKASRGQAGYFRFKLDDDADAARQLEAMVRFRNRWLGMPSGRQGLLIHRSLYEAQSGFLPLDALEDMALTRKLGKRRLKLLPVDAVNSAAPYQKDGYIARAFQDATSLYFLLLGVPAETVAKMTRAEG